jgi:hypothetical protein
MKRPVYRTEMYMKSQKSTCVRECASCANCISVKIVFECLMLHCKITFRLAAAPGQA